MTEKTNAARREETKAVKAALRRAHIPFLRVRHGTGTAWGWLHIKVPGETPYPLQRKAVKVIQAVTGRHGDYDGKIMVYAVD